MVLIPIQIFIQIGIFKLETV